MHHIQQIKTPDHSARQNKNKKQEHGMNEQTQETKAVAKIEPQRAPARLGQNGIQLGDFDALWKFGSMISRSGLAPKGISTPDAICVAIQMGLEVGLPPLAALQNIAVINGRPALWGDAVLGVCRATGDLEEFSEWFEAGGKRLPRNPTTYTDDTTAVCSVKRRGDTQAKEVGFSVADAKRADLWDTRTKIKTQNGGEMANPAPWYCYPFRMLQFRARSFALRDKFGDALRGMKMAEDLQGGTIIDVSSSVVTDTQTFTPPTTATPTTEQAKRLPGRPRKTTKADATYSEASPESAAGTTIQQPTSAPEPGAPTHPTLVEEPLTPQDKVELALTEAGASFESLVAWGRKSQFWGDDDKPKTWTDISTENAEIFLSKIGGLIEALKGGAK